jgi:hypothetical protein
LWKVGPRKAILVHRCPEISVFAIPYSEAAIMDDRTINMLQWHIEAGVPAYIRLRQTLRT